jgi:formylglycine-generating enzyme required for sulfatase activity
MATLASALAPSELAERLRAARARLLALADTLPADAWVGPTAENLNPPLWELGHIAWFQEHWCLRLKAGCDPSESPLLGPLEPGRRPWVDWLYNSSRIPHAARWRAPLLSREETLAYAAEVLEAVTEKISRGDFERDFLYYAELSLHHETMHTEAWWMMWQARGLKPPQVPRLAQLRGNAALRFERGRVTLGSGRTGAFVFDNEKWLHEVEVVAFEIDARPVTNAEFAQYVETGAAHPVYWRHQGGAWQLRRFERWIDLPLDEPVIHVSRHEAAAYAKSRGRRLPSTAEWVRAAQHASFQLGRCWEWTSDTFAPYPGFSADPYADYSAPWFHTHCELRGAGSWVTDEPLARASYRNFFTADRRDPFVGFRTARMAESPA